MTQILSYLPGQTATIFLEIKNNNGLRVDGYEPPIVNNIINPSLTQIDGYPQSMTKIDTGLYYFQYILPTGAASIGNYLINVFYLNPESGIENSETYQIIVTAPFGNFGTTTF